MVKEALDQLRGAVMIVYPMGLPPHDPIRMEFENQEDLSGTQVKQLIVFCSVIACLIQITKVTLIFENVVLIDQSDGLFVLAICVPHPVILFKFFFPLLRLPSPSVSICLHLSPCLRHLCR